MIFTVFITHYKITVVNPKYFPVQAGVVFRCVASDLTIWDTFNLFFCYLSNWELSLHYQSGHGRSAGCWAPVSGSCRSRSLTHSQEDCWFMYLCIFMLLCFRCCMFVFSHRCSSWWYIVHFYLCSVMFLFSPVFPPFYFLRSLKSKPYLAQQCVQIIVLTAKADRQDKVKTNKR